MTCFLRLQPDQAPHLASPAPENYPGRTTSAFSRPSREELSTGARPMAEAKYSVSQQPVQTLLSWIDSGQVAIPEMQRPFVWNSTKVRDLLDSLYQGFPVGYLITW